MPDTEDYSEEATPAAHAETHQAEGTDLISLQDLAGVPLELTEHAGLPTVHQDAPDLISTHKGDASAHHAAYTDTKARAAIGNIFGADGKADADIDLDGHDLKGGNVLLPNGAFIGIGAALERLVFYNTGYATFTGVKVGIGTTGSLSKTFELWGPSADVSMRLRNTDGGHQGYFDLNNDGSAHFTGDNTGANGLFFSAATIGFRTTAGGPNRMIIAGASVGINIGSATPTERLVVNGNTWLQQDNSKLLLGTGKDSSISYNGSQTQFINEVGTGDWAFLTGNVNILAHDGATLGLKLASRLVTEGINDSGGVGFRVLLIPNI